VFPSWNRRGGCAIQKKTASEAAQTGWSDRRATVFAELTTPSAPFQRRLRGIFLMARPPLLSQEGNTLASWLSLTHLKP
jgi:hypothetical protein